MEDSDISKKDLLNKLRNLVDEKEHKLLEDHSEEFDNLLVEITEYVEEY